jgi:site-specific DNA-methyltransferase (adenine-specific)
MTLAHEQENLKIYCGDNLEILKTLEDNSIDLIYIDPPFALGKVFTSHNGSFTDIIVGDEFIRWIEPRIRQAKRILAKSGSFFIHMDYREIHYVKVLCDQIFGRESFMNEIIWHYDFGARQKTKWATKHDNILWYVNNTKEYTFNIDKIDLIPKLAPGLPVSKNRKDPDKKMLTDVWFNTIVPTNGKERLGYPTQKPMAILERIVKVHSKPGDMLLDYFAGSGSFGDAALKHGRKAIMMDENPDAISIMKKRFSKYLDV